MFNIINITIIVSILIIAFLLFKFKKLQTLAVLAALKAEALGMGAGSKKLEWAVEWLYKQKLFKDSFLALIPKNFTKWIVDFVFNQNKLLIEKEYRNKP